MQRFLEKAKSKLTEHQGDSQSADTASHAAHATKPQPHAAPSDSSLAPHQRHGDAARMKWPPKVDDITVLGEVKDTNGRNIPRDFGRSVRLGGHLYYMFADTFCFDDKGDFKGLTNNTIAHIPDRRQPLQSTYLSQEPKVPEFIPFTPDELQYNQNPEHKQKNSRIANWAFGGIIEDDPPGCGKGWILNDKTQIQNGGSQGMDFVRVELHDGHHIHAHKVGPSPFTKQDPRFGCAATIVHAGWVYLLGAKKDAGGWPRNVMARIKHGADLLHKPNYQYFTQKHGWADSFEKSEDLVDVLPGQAQGAIFYVPKHGPNGRPFLWVGVDKWMDSKMWLASAEQPEGPWDNHEMLVLPKFLNEKSNHRYCLYPHQWAYDLGQGQLLITWSDDGQMGGIVVAAKVTFAMDESRPARDEL